MIKVYAKTDRQGCIIAVNSFVFLADTFGWIQIDEGEGDRFTHAQGNYFPLPIITEGGAYRYKYIDGRCIERTAEEIAADEQAEAAGKPTADERLEALEAAMLEMMMGGTA